jgi:hypothetical protein
MRGFLAANRPALAIEALLMAAVADPVRIRVATLAREAGSRRTDRRM